jgi:hypothetical protein
MIFRLAELTVSLEESETNISLKIIIQHLELLYKFNIQFLFQRNNLVGHPLSCNREKVYFHFIVSHSHHLILTLKKYLIKIMDVQV